MTFGCRFRGKTQKYDRGEGDGLPQIRVVVRLVSLCMPVVHWCTQKCFNYALINLLFGLCKSV
jgi:hypothetical protein